jgi:hypothetical protein
VLLFVTLHQVFVSLADCNIDYVSLEEFPTASRSIIRVGDVRFCSNIVRPAVGVQAYNLSLGDLSYQLCNTRCPYNFENSLLPGATGVMAPRDLSFNDTHSDGVNALVSTDYTFRMGFKTLLTLDSLRAVIVNKNSKTTAELSTEPRLTTSLAVGEVSLYACKDSFACFIDTVGELETKVSAVSNEELEELKSHCRKTDSNDSKSNGAHEAPVTARSHYSEAVSVDADGNFLLDGYDWTTIDHDGGSEILPGEEQASRWYHATGSSSPRNSIDSSRVDLVRGNSVFESSSPHIIDHHFPFHLGVTEGPQFAGPLAFSVNSRLLVHDLKLKVRLFDGYDWPQSQKRRKLEPRALFVIEEPRVLPVHVGKGGAGDGDILSAKNRHLEGLIGSSSEKAGMFANMPLPAERALSIMAQSEVRQFSRRTNTYLQLSADGISLRIDSYPESMENRLKSSIDCSLKDFFLAETISSVHPVKMIGEWFNEMEHPRDTNDGLLMLRVRAVSYIYLLYCSRLTCLHA